MTNFVIEFGKVGKPPEADGRMDAPAFHRNHRAIWASLGPYLVGCAGDALEVGSGTGQHIIEFARHSPDIVWWPSDANDRHLRSIEAWRRHAKLDNVRPPRRLDASAADWGFADNSLVAIFCANVLHIAPWQVALGLFAGAGRYLRSGSRLFIYGPFMRDGEHTAPSNAEFDASLRASNPQWGVRDIAELAALAGEKGLNHDATIDLPANNLLLVFVRD